MGWRSWSQGLKGAVVVRRVRRVPGRDEVAGGGGDHHGGRHRGASRARHQSLRRGGSRRQYGHIRRRDSRQDARVCSGGHWNRRPCEKNACSAVVRCIQTGLPGKGFSTKHDVRPSLASRRASKAAACSGHSHAVSSARATGADLSREGADLPREACRGDLIASGRRHQGGSAAGLDKAHRSHRHERPREHPKLRPWGRPRGGRNRQRRLPNLAWRARR